MHVPQTILLLDGPIWPGIPASREQMIRDMAADLVTYDAFRNEGDAQRALHATGKYRAFNVFVLARPAMQWATEEIIAKEMSDVRDV